MVREFDLCQYCTNNWKSKKKTKNFRSRIHFFPGFFFPCIKNINTKAHNTVSFSLTVTYQVSDKTTLIDLKLIYCYLLNSSRLLRIIQIRLVRFKRCDLMTGSCALKHHNLTVTFLSAANALHHATSDHCLKQIIFKFIICILFKSSDTLLFLVTSKNTLLCSSILAWPEL